MEAVRSAAAMAGYIDVEMAVHSAAMAMSEAKTEKELRLAYNTYVKPVESQLGKPLTEVLGRYHDLKFSVILMKKM